MWKYVARYVKQVSKEFTTKGELLSSTLGYDT